MSVGFDGAERVDAAVRALDQLTAHTERVERLGRQLARAFRRGHRLLVLGSRRSTLHAQYLATSLVDDGGFGRAPLPALALGADLASLVGSSDGVSRSDALARQVRAHGRPGDVLVALSADAAGEVVLDAVKEGLRMGLRTIGFTGPLPNPLAALCCDVVAVDAGEPATVSEVHLVALHVLCSGIERERTSAELVPAPRTIATCEAPVEGPTGARPVRGGQPTTSRKMGASALLVESRTPGARADAVLVEGPLG